MGIRFVPVLLSAVLASPAFAQETPAPEGAPQGGGADKVEELLERIKKLEERLERVERPKDGEGEAPASQPTSKPTSQPSSSGDKPQSKKEEKKEGGYGTVRMDEEGVHIELPFSMRVKFNGKLRVRGEFRDPDDYRIPGQFGRAATEDSDDANDFAVMRTRFSFDLQVHKYLRAFIELQDSRTWGDTPLVTDTAELFLRQGFMELQQPLDMPIWLKLGRFAVPRLGDARLVTDPDFNNINRQWDGVQLTYALGADENGENPKLWATAFAANIREGSIFSAEQDENDDFWFSGLYVSARMLPGHEFDAYLFWRHLSDRVFTSERNGRVGDRKDFTLGFRMKGGAGPVGYSAEVAWQYGDQAGDRIRAWAGGIRAWVVVPITEEQKIAFIGDYSYATGDRDPFDGKRQTFDPLLPAAHFWHGHMDLFLWSNIHIVMLGTRVHVLPNLTLHADGHMFTLDKKRDAWYRINKQPHRRDTTGRARSYVGAELDLYFKYQLWERLSLWGGYSHFWAGQYVRDTAKGTGGRGSGDQGWLHMMAEIKF